MKKLVILVALALIGSLLVFYGGQTVRASHATGGPVAYWPFDDGSDPTDDVAHDNDGDLKPISSEPTFDSSDKAPVPSNARSLVFDGIDDFIEVPDDALLRSMTDLTISAWIKVETTGCPDSTGLPGEICTIVRRDTLGGLAARTLYNVDLLDGKLRLAFIGSASGGVTVATATGPDLRDGDWHHVAIVRDNTVPRARGYVDGSQVIDVPDASAGDFAGVTSTPVFIGQWDVDGRDRRFKGRIDEVKLYDRPLSDDEIISTFLTGDTGTLFVDDDGEVGLGSSVDCDGAGVSVYDVIQDAVDAAEFGDTVLVCTGTFSESVVFGSEDSGITLSAAPSASPVLDGTSLVGSATSVFGITVLDGVTGVTIEGLTIRDYEGDGSGSDRSSAIMAWDVATSDITVRDNKLLDNFWNGVLVGSEGSSFVHDSWIVIDNTVEDNVFVGIELTNAGNSEITDNTLDDNGFAGIVVQARNTIPNSGLFIHPGEVEVVGNTVSDSPSGIYLIALASQPLPPFPAILAARSVLKGVLVEENEVTGATDGIRLVGFVDGTIRNINVNDNTVTASSIGIRVTTFSSFVPGGSADNNNIHHNSVTSTGTWAITLEAGASINKVHHNSLVSNGGVNTGDSAVDISDPGAGNKVFNNT